MAILGIELCDAGLQAVASERGRPGPLLLPGSAGPLGWMGLVSHDGNGFSFGCEAEAGWFVHPRRICHSFWPRLSHEPSALGRNGKPLLFSQLAYYFLRDYHERLTAAVGVPDKLLLAVPGAYLKDAATEDEKIGLLLGMASELQLPLAGVVDMACAALSDPRLGHFDRTRPLLLVDIHLHGAEITLLQQAEGRFVRQDYAHLPQSGYAEFLRHATTSMGNRFLRHTTFDIMENGHIEQVFYGQLKEFLLAGAAEHHFQINVGNRTYEMTATRDQLVADAAALVQALVQGTRAFLLKSTGRTDHCTVALTDRVGLLPGIEARFRAAGLPGLLRLPPGAAAAGAARAAEERSLPENLADVPVETSSPAALAPPPAAPWEARLMKANRSAAFGPPTHAICEGVGRALEGRTVFTIGAGGGSVDLALPGEFDPAGADCLIRLELRTGQWRMFLQPAGDTEAGRVVEAGDRLVVRCGAAETEVWFACCAESPGSHRPRF